MFIIGEAMLMDDAVQERFACDLGKCRGACCTLPGGRGAPLDDAEVAEIVRAFPAARKYLSDEHLRVIDAEGFVEGVPGSYATVCVDNRACVFVYEDGSGIARCALERAHLEGETAWRKPISCHLFPLRISSGTPAVVRYERIPECHPAIRRGEAENVPLHEFLEEALTRRFGASWYGELLLRLEGARTAADLPDISSPSAEPC